MLNPKELQAGQEQFEPYTSSFNRHKLVQYDYRHSDGTLFSCVKKTLTECRKAKDEWMKNKK